MRERNKEGERGNGTRKCEAREKERERGRVCERVRGRE